MYQRHTWVEEVAAGIDSRHVDVCCVLGIPPGVDHQVVGDVVHVAIELAPCVGAAPHPGK